MADVAQMGAVADLVDAQPHALVGDRGEPPRQDGGLADVVHAAGIAVPAILDDLDVDIEYVAVLEDFLARGAVAYMVFDRGADGGGGGRIARGRVGDSGARGRPEA